MAVFAAGVLAAILIGTLERLLLPKAQHSEWRGIETQTRNKTFKPKKFTFFNISHARETDMLRPDVSVGISGWGGWCLQFSHHQHVYSRSPVSARSNASICGHSLARTAGSNRAEGLDVCLLWLLSGRGV
jgi:hypothetical protein